MREYQIKIEPFEFIALRELKIDRKVNEHTMAEITMCIENDKQMEYMKILSGETWVKIIGVGEQNERGEVEHNVLLHGVVIDFQLSYDGYETTLKIKIASGTILMDFRSHFRVLQNKDSLCGDIYNQITNAYPNGKAICQEGKGEKIKGVLIQYQETDWKFLKRIAGRTGLYLVPDVQKKGIRHTIGLPIGTKRKISLNNISIRINIGCCLQKSRNGMPSLQVEDMQELILTDREIYQIGDYISYQGKEYFIHEIHTMYEKGECNHTYCFKTKAAIKILPFQHDEVTGCSFSAIIVGVKKDEVQIEIEHDEWKGMDGKKWFLYSTVYSSADGTGWYCMPEKGDSVRLYVPSKEEDSFVFSAVHKPTDSSRQNPDYKSLKTKFGKEIRFTPESILVTNNQGMMIEMDDNEGITISSNKNIVIEAGDNLTVASTNSSLLLAAEEYLQVKQGSTSMTLDEDIHFAGGEFRIQ